MFSEPCRLEDRAIGSASRDRKYGLTFERVNEVLAYDADTGIFRWKVKVSDRAPVGKIAGGHTSSGHWRIRIDGHYYLAHRLAWLLVIGEWPSSEIDHKNRIRDDNKWNNLRVCTASQNHANSKLYAGNSTGFKGVQFVKSRKKFIAIVVKDGRRHHCGFHLDAAAAHAAYAVKAKELFGDFFHSGAENG